MLFRSYSDKKLADILRVECSDGEGRQTKPFLLRIGLGYPGLHNDLKNAFTFLRKRLILILNTEHLLLPVSVEILASTWAGDQKAALQEITDVIRRLDIDIAAIDITQRELAPDELSPAGITKLDAKTGTKHAVSIASTHKDDSEIGRAHV